MKTHIHLGVSVYYITSLFLPFRKEHTLSCLLYSHQRKVSLGQSGRHLRQESQAKRVFAELILPFWFGHYLHRAYAEAEISY